jgi:hypothetical protein
VDKCSKGQSMVGWWQEEGSGVGLGWGERGNKEKGKGISSWQYSRRRGMNKVWDERGIPCKRRKQKANIDKHR